MAKAYSLNLRPGEARVAERGDGYAVVELPEAGRRGQVRVRALSACGARLLVSWQ